MAGEIHTEGNVLVYPSTGRLLFATDFHGQLEDYRRVVSLYQRRREAGEDVYLLFAGDFVHGPCYPPEQFPEHLGDYHPDGTVELLEELGELLSNDDRVRSLLGNHEHGHLGGVRTEKFHRDPDEVGHLEALLGPGRTERVCALFETFALAALTPCGVLFLHGAPNVKEAGFREVAEAEITGLGNPDLFAIYDVPVIGELLWSKGANPEVAEAFLERMAFEGIRPRVAVYGHDIVRDGVWRVATNQMLFSTSFGLFRDKKTLLEIDLSVRYESSADFRDGAELFPLYA